MSKCEIETTIKGGLPVIVRASVHPAEPDVGIFTKQVDIDDICWLSGKSVSRKIYNSISAEDFERIATEVIENG